MNNFEYPKYSRSQRSGKMGEAFFSDFVHSKLSWIYRTVHQEEDFGIDGYIDIVTNGYVTGQTIGVQIKCGDSYFQKTSDGGIRYEGENKHLNYYLNSSHPIIFIVLDGKATKGKWVKFDVNITSETKPGWWIEVPNQNILDLSVKELWSAIAGPAFNYSEQIAANWKVNSVLDESDFGIITITKNEIETCDFTGVNNFINRLSRNKVALIKNRGKLEILVADYDEDPRELYEIPEVRRWFAKSIEVGIPWFYFLGSHGDGIGLIVFLLCCCDIEIYHKGGKKKDIKFRDFEQVMEWLNFNYVNLNNFSDDKEIPIEINKEMSEKAYDLMKIYFTSNE